MGTYGRETIDAVGGFGITVSADGAPKFKHVGACIAWAAVPAHDAAARTFKHEDIVPADEKFIRYGTIICKITAATDVTEIGKYMPYMAVPGGGRTLSTARGDCFIVNESVHADDRNSDYPAAFEGGRVYRRRLLVVGYGDGTGADASEVNEGREAFAGAAAENAADLAYLNIDALPAATFLATFPMITFVNES